jgi:prepilin-type N-terminal cleavage/methylation domain-containing protein
MISDMKKGFTLTEFLVSMVVVAIGFLALASLMNLSRGSSIGKDVRSKGIEYLQEEIELFETMSYRTIVESFNNDTEYDDSENLPSHYTRRFRVSHDDPMKGIVRVRISVSWEEGNETWTMGIETYITRD